MSLVKNRACKPQMLSLTSRSFYGFSSIGALLGSYPMTRLGPAHGLALNSNHQHAANGRTLQYRRDRHTINGIKWPSKAVMGLVAVVEKQYQAEPDRSAPLGILRK